MGQSSTAQFLEATTELVGKTIVVTTRESILNKQRYNMLPIVHVKLLSRPFEYQVLKAIFSTENINKSLFKLRKEPSTWGWASRWEIAHRMGFNVGTRENKQTVAKSLSRKIRRAFLWLGEHGYLKHFDVNKPGMNPNNLEGATRFLLAFWMLKVVAEAIAGTLLGLKYLKTLKEVSRTPNLAPDGWKPPKWSVLAGRVMS